MKFQVRDGFVVEVSEQVEIGPDKFQTQIQTFYGGKQVELNEEQATVHIHKLEPLDKAAVAFAASKHTPDPKNSIVAEDLNTQVQTEVQRQMQAFFAGMKAAQNSQSLSSLPQQPGPTSAPTSVGGQQSPSK
jgi:Tfp pilus assembly PilM family ATPase